MSQFLAQFPTGLEPLLSSMMILQIIMKNMIESLRLKLPYSQFATKQRLHESRLEDPETDLFEAPVCKNKGAQARLYDNTCRCARYLHLSFEIFVS